MSLSLPPPLQPPSPDYTVYIAQYFPRELGHKFALSAAFADQPFSPGPG